MLQDKGIWKREENITLTMNIGNPQLKVKLNMPVTFSYRADDESRRCNDVFFLLDDDLSNARFSVKYRNESYSVANVSTAEQSRRKDYTLEILSMLHQLVNLNKSAAGVRTTPSVQVLSRRVVQAREL